MISDKLQKLQAMLEKTPNDSFLIYAIGMEYKKRSDWPNAVAQFSRAIDVDLNYCYAYYQRGQAQESAGDVAAARDSYLAGIEAANRTNDDHARSELEDALSMIAQQSMLDELKQFLKHPHWRRQHKWRRAIWTTMSRLGMNGMHALPMNRRWIDIHRRKMPIVGLHESLEGMKIIQISDLHFSPVVWGRYLVQCIRWVNELEPDLVVVTGDLITGGYRYADRVAHILAGLKSKHGTICTFGNHDYSFYGKNGSPEAKRRGSVLQQSLEKRGLIVLRNDVHRVKLSSDAPALTIVGLDDEWSGHLDPKRAWAKVKSDEPIICLNHNPANVLELMQYPWQWMLAGHTHGRQVATSRFGRRFYPHRYRHYTHGYYCVQGRHLYVNRGLAYGQRIHSWCRPEVTVFKLASETVPECV